MGFTVVKEIKGMCSCNPTKDGPAVAEHGTIIECEDCGAQYIREYDQREGNFWQILPASKEVVTTLSGLYATGQHQWRKQKRPI